jgi:inosose dehydratase
MDEIRVGNAPCSWGTLEFAEKQSERVGCGEMLDQLAAAGYTGSELGDWGFMPTDPESLSKEFRSRNLSLTGAFVPVALREASAHEAGLAQCLKTASLLRDTTEMLSQEAEPFLVLADDNGADPIRTRHAGRITSSMGLTRDEWKVFASGADLIARTVLDETGLRTVFHHHCAGFVETPDEIQQLLDATDPGNLGLVFDTGHYAFGAGGCDDVVAAMDCYASRIWYVHFKDVEPGVLDAARVNSWDYFEAVRHGVFCELGDGCIDFAAVYAWLQRQGYTGYVTVEQDILPGMGTPEESARRGRAYLRSIGL